MNDANIPIIGGDKQWTGDLTLRAYPPEALLGEIERRGISLPQVSFQLLQSLCEHRSRRWREGDTDPWSAMERSAEIAGEVGELINAVKKLHRHDTGMAGNYKPGEQDRDELLRRAAYELGDVLVCVFNLAQKLNVDAFNCMQMAFNTKSDEMGFPEKI